MFGEPVLQQGVQGQETAVRRLKKCLKEYSQVHGSRNVTDPGSIDGNFDAKTKASVRSFQRNLGSGPVTGTVAAITWSWLDTFDRRFPDEQDLKKGDQGIRVRHLQRKLFAADSNPGEIDGIYGDSVERAVKDFQKKQGIPQDGAAGGKTRELLSFVAC